MAIIKKLFFSPVKSLSFQNTVKCEESDADFYRRLLSKNDKTVLSTLESKIGFEQTKKLICTGMGDLSVLMTWSVDFCAQARGEK